MWYLLSDYFDKTYVIHLPVRETKLAGEMVYATPPSKGFTMSNMRRNPAAEFGVNLSHIKAIVRAMNDKAERPLFLEDDVEIVGSLPELPSYYDVLYLGGHPREPVKRAGNNLVRVGKFSFAESYSISRKALVPFFEFWCNRIGQPDAMYDFILGEFAAANIGYAVYPPITKQSGDSLVAGRRDDKRELVERGWKNNLSTK